MILHKNHDFIDMNSTRSKNPYSFIPKFAVLIDEIKVNINSSVGIDS